MFKKLKAGFVIVSIFMILMLLSGCVQMIIGVNISDDGSADISIKAGLSTEVYDMLSSDESDPISEMRTEAENNGYSAEEYDENDYRGIIMTKHINNLEDGSETDRYLEGITFTNTKSILKNSMTLNGLSKYSQSFKQNMTDSSIDISDFDMKLVVSVPYPITKTNAAQISDDKKTATFDLTALDSIELECESGMSAKTIVLLIVIILAVIAVIVAAAIFASKRKTVSNLSDDNKEQE